VFTAFALWALSAYVLSAGSCAWACSTASRPGTVGATPSTVTWAEVSHARGRTLGPLTGWHDLGPDDHGSDAWEAQPPEEGNLPPGEPFREVTRHMGSGTR
jgi:hypothetical protein